MTTALVTGGTGCIGSNLAAELLRRGFRVRILRRKNSDLRAITGIPVEDRVGDLLDEHSLRTAMDGCDVVFHAAAIVSFDRSIRDRQYAVNVLGTRNIVRTCLSTGIRRLVHTSSIAAVGFTDDDTLATEDTPYNWGSASGYRYSKHCAELEVLEGVKNGLDAVIVNPSVVIGERDIHFHGGRVIREVKRGRIPFYIAGGLNVVYVGDVVQGHILAMQKGRTGERYILGGENVTHKELLERTATLVGGRKPIAKLPTPLLGAAVSVIEYAGTLLGMKPVITRDLALGGTRRHWFSSAKAERELGYTSSSFDHAVTSAYRWYMENGFL